MRTATRERLHNAAVSSDKATPAPDDESTAHNLELVGEIQEEDPGENIVISRIEEETLSRFYREMKEFQAILTRKEQIALGRRVHDEKDQDARNILVVHNLRLVLWVARKYLWAVMPRSQKWLGLEYADLIQEGVLGLIEAAERYDYRMGFTFATYAPWWIRQSIYRAIANSDLIRIPVHMHERLSRVRRAAAQLSFGSRALPTIAAVAAESDSTIEEIRDALRVNRMQTMSIDEPARSGDVRSMPDDAAGLHERISDEETLVPEQALAAHEALNESVNRLRSLIGVLGSDPTISRRNKEIFCQLFGLNQSLERRTLENVGKQYHISRERVRQICVSILKKLNSYGHGIDLQEIQSDIVRIHVLESITGRQANISK